MTNYSLPHQAMQNVVRVVQTQVMRITFTLKDGCNNYEYIVEAHYYVVYQ